MPVCVCECEQRSERMKNEHERMNEASIIVHHSYLVGHLIREPDDTVLKYDHSKNK